jgi:hypothetical protein
LSCWLGGVASDAPDLVLLHERRVGEEVGDDGTALVACGAEDCDDFRHGGNIYIYVCFVNEVNLDVLVLLRRRRSSSII